MVKARGVCVQPGTRVGAVPGLIWTSLDGGAVVRLVSRCNPVDSERYVRSSSKGGSGLNERDGIAVRRSVPDKLHRFPLGSFAGRRHAAIRIDREGTCRCDPTEDCTTD